VVTQDREAPSLVDALRRWSSLLIIFGTLLVTLSSVGLWIEWTLLSERGFVEVSTSVFEADETRETIASAIVDTMFEKRPILRGLVRGPIEGVITGLLGSSFFNSALAFASEQLWELLFIGRDRVVLDIEPLHDFIYAIITVAAPGVAESIDPEQLPSELVLLDGSEIPNLGVVSSVASWTSIFAFVIGVGLIAFAVSRSWTNQALRSGVIVWTGIFLIAEALLIVIATFPVRSSLILAVENASGRSVIATTYGILVIRLYIILIGLALVGLALAVYGLWKSGRIFHSSVPA
jgi:hypothetical protein